MSQDETEMTMEKLARMVQDGFTEVFERMDMTKTELSTDLQTLKDELSIVKRDVAEIRYKLPELAHRDETRELEERADRVEKHLGLPPLKPALK